MSIYLSRFHLKNAPFPEIAGEIPENDLMPEPETSAYIHTRLVDAGMETPLFTEGSLRMIYTYTKGDRKLIHTICDYALHRAFHTNQTSVPEELLSECLALILESKPPDTYEGDKRRHKRISTNFPGTFHIPETKTRGMLTVTNISRAGIQIKLARQRLVKVNDRANILFKLDDLNQSDIRTAVGIRHTFGFYAGCIFRHTDNHAFNQYLDNLLQQAEQKWRNIQI
ncbi:MAG: hypothetical protein C4522_11485 [Desulfobacteraceae bacterium]|nr:MAG: hypothetical protein C4522_11485 [Desulfobacteraceae bacterium]